MRGLTDVPVSRNGHKTVLRKSINIKFCIKIVGLNRSTATISQRSLSNLGLLLLLFKFNNFSFIKDMIENINCT